jgi:hypothetical protein
VGQSMCDSGGAIMTLLVLTFYTSAEKTPIRQWINTVDFPAVWLGARLFRGAPLTRTTDAVFNLYLIACTAVEGFLVGLFIDFIGKRNSGQVDVP